MNRLITILGPTAVGKTDATLRLAEVLTSPVISGDAYQIYRHMNIGTAKPSEEELGRIPHYLIDIKDPSESYSVVEFQEDATKVIIETNEKGHIPILSGGTGLYVQSLVEGYHFNDVDKDPSLRERLQHILDREGVEGLMAYGRSLAQEAGITLPFEDTHRLMRAIELLEAGEGHLLTTQTKEGLIFDGPVIGLMRERQALYDRINLRVDLMVQGGLFDEVEHLVSLGIPPESQAFKAIGYREVLPYIMGQCTKEDAIDQIKQNTRRFAKRQITWYKRMPYIQWVFIDEHTASEEVFQQVWQLCQAHYPELR